MTTRMTPPSRRASPITDHRLGLPQSTALITGSIIGVGIFSLPYSLASYGPISLVALGLATVGSVALAFMFAVMSRRMPADGGPYAYARSAFGNSLGFANACHAHRYPRLSRPTKSNDRTSSRPTAPLRGRADVLPR
jgi:amino acid transporter